MINAARRTLVGIFAINGLREPDDNGSYGDSAFYQEAPYFEIAADGERVDGELNALSP
jgi:hypothetical protein